MDFYTKNKYNFESWLIILEKICILTTFSMDFSLIKILGKGNYS